MKKIRTTLNIERIKPKQAIDRGIWKPSRQNWKEVVEDYLIISRKRYQNKLSMFLLQGELLIQIDTQQKSIRMLKDVINNPGNVHNYNPTFVPDNEEELIKDATNQLEETFLILKCLKDIADGHLWRMFNFNYALLYFLGMHPSPGNLDPDQSFINEFNQWGNSILDTEIKQFILNDITNYARIGDLIILNKDDTLEIQEIKSGKSQRGLQRSARLKRQEEKRKQFEKLVNERETTFEGMKYKILDTNVPFKTSLDKVKKTLNESKLSGMTGRSIYPHLNIVCIDSTKITDGTISKEEYKNLLDTYNEPINDEDIILSHFSFQRTAYSPNFLPYSIYPFSEELIADLMFSKKAIFYSFNISEFYRQLESKNWKVIKRLEDWDLDNDEKPEAFCLVHKDGLTIPLSWPLINNIIFETLKIENLIDLFDEMYSMVDKSNDALYFPNFSNEETLWK